MTCTVPSCPNLVRTAGYCSKHYQRWWKYGDPLAMRLDRSPIAPGSRFAQLVVLAAEEGGSGSRRYLCVCSCGGQATVRGSHLKSGAIRSCGCLRKQVTAERNASRGHGYAVHGHTHPLYSTWASMHKRCTSPKHKKWPHYGGRGIVVCARWTGPEGFPNFLADMGEKPAWADGGLDRIDNDGNYEPSNCRWSTRSQQRQNRRSPTKTARPSEQEPACRSLASAAQ